MTTGDYSLFGLRLRSSVPLPELAPWPSAAPGDEDILVALAPVPEPPGEAGTSQRWTIGADGAAVLHVPDLARMRVAGGRLIELDISCAERESWRALLFGSAVGALCHQRGFFPLHAASLRIGDRAVAIAGRSGAGKSTLSFALFRRGAALLSDDLTVLRRRDDGVTDILPAFPRLKLWRDAIEARGLSVEGLARVTDGAEKFDLRLGRDFEAAPRRLDGVLILREGPEPRLRRLSKLEALPALWSNVHRRKIGVLLGRREALFAQAAALAQSAPVYEFARPMDFDALDAGAALIEERFAASAP